MALFKRRIRPHITIRLMEYLYPKTGYLRALHYFKHRTMRLKGSAASIAGGLACGVAVSFTPFIGLHFLLAMAIAWLIRANIVASMLGTMAGNPVTFVPIWILIYETGSLLLGRVTEVGDIKKLTGSMEYEGALGFFEKLPDLFWPIIWPMLLGGLIWAPIAWIASYYILKPIIAEYQFIRRFRRMKHKSKDTEND